MKKKKTSYVVIALIVVLLALGIGYATFGGVLNITGTVNTSTNAFNVKFTDASTGDVAGVISSDGQTVTANNIVLAQPGDSKTIVAKIENLGTLDVLVNNFTITKTGATADQAAIDVAVSPTTNINLLAGTSQYVTITVTWLSGTSSTLTGAVGFTATANYAQNP